MTLSIEEVEQMYPATATCQLFASSWENVFDGLRHPDTKLKPVGNFWAALQEVERQLSQQGIDVSVKTCAKRFQEDKP